MSNTQSNKPESRPFYTVKQYAKRRQCSEKTVRRDIKSGKLIAHKFGSQVRISEADGATYERINRRPL